MGLNHQDLELMMRGIAAPGDAAMQVRQEQDRRQAQGIEQELRQKMLEQEIRRTTAEESRASTLSQGKTQAWLQGDDGGIISYTGPKEGLDHIIYNAQQTGKPLKPIAKPTKETPFQLKMNLPKDGAEVTAHAPDVDTLDKIITKIKEQHQTGPTDRPVGKSAVAEALEQATKWRGLGNSDYADTLEAWAKKQTKDRPLTQNITESFDAVPEHREGGFLGFGGTKIPAVPKRTVRTQAPIAPSPTGISETAPPAKRSPTDPGVTRQQAIDAINSGKDANAVRARYKQLTGQDL